MILDGKKIKNQILDELKEEVNKLIVKPKLVVIQVGNNEASNVYIKQKNNMCNYIGYDFEHIKLDLNDLPLNLQFDTLSTRLPHLSQVKYIAFLLILGLLISLIIYGLNVNFL